MAIRGFFSDTRLVLGGPGSSPSPAALPYVWSTVHLPAYHRRALVAFLIDTGADVTTLHPQDGLRLLLPAEISRMPNPAAIGGAGAGIDHYPVGATIVFMHDDGRLHSIGLTAYVAQPTAQNMRYESLLGRDALEHFVMHYDQRARTVTLGT
jgi:hypothetical protein